jgi:hypothetical protein
MPLRDPQPLPSQRPDAGFADLLDPCNGLIFRNLFQIHPDLLEAMAKDLRAGAAGDNTTELLQAPVAQLRGQRIGKTELHSGQLFGKDVRLDVCALRRPLAHPMRGAGRALPGG